MSNDFLVRILPAGANDLRMYLTASDPKLEDRGLLRSRFTLPDKDVDDLRRGNPTDALVDQVSEKITQWLLGDELKVYLETALKKDMRLILSVDEELLPILADIPIELLKYNLDWFALYPQVTAIVHRLQKIGPPQDSLTSHSWPFRVLIVRSNPTDLTRAVPPAAPICDYIVALGKEIGLTRDSLQVDLLSSEEGALGPATWTSLQEHLADRYDILVYLGHGDLQYAPNSKVPIGVLQLEDANGGHESVRSDQLKSVMLQRKQSVPVVLLAGCLTAAEMGKMDDARRTAIVDDLPKSLRGSQGVAQALVNSEAGVQFAVGMRFQLETQAALGFLHAFFESLLKTEPGNVESGVRAGRARLFAASPYPPSWSAPVIFRTSGKEPMFGFLASPPKTYQIDAVDQRDQEYRDFGWKKLLEHPGLEFAYQTIAYAEAQMQDKAVRQGAYLFPERVEPKPGESPILPIKLFGNLEVSLLRCKLIIGGEGNVIERLRSAQALKESGYKLGDISESGNSEISFSIIGPEGGNIAPLPEATLVEAKLTLGTATGVAYPISLQILETKPLRVVRPGTNIVLIVPA